MKIYVLYYELDGDSPYITLHKTRESGEFLWRRLLEQDLSSALPPRRVEAMTLEQLSEYRDDHEGCASFIDEMPVHTRRTVDKIQI